MKSATKALAGPLVNLLRRADLLNATVGHDDDAVGERERLALVVGDVERGLAQSPLQLAQLPAHGETELEVEVRQRLIEQQDARLEHDAARNRDALLLAAGKLARITGCQIGQAHQLERVDPPVAATRHRRCRRRRRPNATFSKIVRCGNSA